MLGAGALLGALLASTGGCFVAKKETVATQPQPAVVEKETVVVPAREPDRVIVHEHH